MVLCCVPQCGTDSWKCDPSITFHDFPSTPDIAAKWIQQINAAVRKSKAEPMWFPKGMPMVCSKHFLSTDFKDDSDTLKHRVVPTVFGSKYIGLQPEIEEVQTTNVSKPGPMIVKIKTENGGKEDIVISDYNDEIQILETLINEPENFAPNTIKSSKNSNTKYVKPPIKKTNITHPTLNLNNTINKQNPSIAVNNINIQSSVNANYNIQALVTSSSNIQSKTNSSANIQPKANSSANVQSKASSGINIQPTVNSITNIKSTINSSINVRPTINSNTNSQILVNSDKTKYVKPLTKTNNATQSVASSSKTYSIPPTDKVNMTYSNEPQTELQSGGVKRKSDFVDPKSKNTALSNKSPLKPKLNQTKTRADSKITQKRDSNDKNLIEIGPNTFLKINPDIIKINKKLTPSGNTVLQFLMDQNLASTIGADVLPKIVQGAISNLNSATENLMKQNLENASSEKENNSENVTQNNVQPKQKVQHVIGHLVDTHVCQDSCDGLDPVGDEALIDSDSDNNNKTSPEKTTKKSSPIKKTNNDVPVSATSPFRNEEAANEKELQLFDADTNCIEKAPVLLTTNTSMAHCFMEKTKYLTNIRTKARQIAGLKQKVASLNKRIEELEDRCVVQERQLSFTFLKRLRAIRKNASKGDPPATYILEQIRAYNGTKQMRWSDSTLSQCAVWCRKAPYAYEYFKKADFFKLPCLGTVKRYIKKHPELSFQNKQSTKADGGEDDDSSSDFDFDEEDSTEEQEKEIADRTEEAIVCETVLSEENNQPQQESHESNQQSEPMDVDLQPEPIARHASVHHIKTADGTFPVEVDGSNLELQELILPSGEVVQCYSSNDAATGGQYYIIPSAGDQGSENQEYSIVQAGESVILQNMDHSQLNQEQLIFISNPSEQVDCTETEVITDR